MVSEWGLNASCGLLGTQACACECVLTYQYELHGPGVYVLGYVCDKIGTSCKFAWMYVCMYATCRAICMYVGVRESLDVAVSSLEQELLRSSLCQKNTLAFASRRPIPQLRCTNTYKNMQPYAGTSIQIELARTHTHVSMFRQLELDTVILVL